MGKFRLIVVSIIQQGWEWTIQDLQIRWLEIFRVTITSHPRSNTFSSSKLIWSDPDQTNWLCRELWWWKLERSVGTTEREHALALSTENLLENRDPVKCYMLVPTRRTNQQIGSWLYYNSTIPHSLSSNILSKPTSIMHYTPSKWPPTSHDSLIQCYLELYT